MKKNRRWTLEEKRYLEDNWGTVSINTIAKKLNRTRNAINTMAQRMELGPFLQSGDYISWNQLQIALGCGSGSGYKITSWVKNREFPLHTKRVGTNSFKIVYLKEFWQWAEKHMELLDFSRFEENVLGQEPEWAKEKRKRDVEKNNSYITTPWTSIEDSKLEYLTKKQKYTYRELSVIMRRTEGAIQRRLCDLGLKDRPLKADNHIRWTEQDFEILSEMIKSGCSYEYMSEKLGKSAKAIRGKVYAMYLTENLDKARKLIGTGSFGNNRPERRLKQWNVMNTEERAEVRNLIFQLTGILNYRMIKN